MTLGIGVLCDHGETMITGSERRATYRARESLRIGPNEECGKQFRLEPHRVFVSVAGSMSLCHKVYAQFAHAADNLNLADREPLSPERVATLIDDARFHELKRIYSWQIRKKMGVTLHQWASGRLPHGIKMHELIVKYGLDILKQTPFKCELILAGFVGERGLFLRASQKDAIQEETSPGVYAIGIGQPDAMRHLNKRGQNVHMGLARSLLHVYEALYVSQSKYVGPPPKFLIVVRKRQPRAMIYPTGFLESWRKTYETRTTTASLDDSRVAGTEVYARLRALVD